MKLSDRLLHLVEAVDAGAVTGTPEFRRWFAGSKVVDGNGDPLVVYSGGPVFDRFDTAWAEFGAFWASEEIDTAQSYAEKWSGSVEIKPLYLRLLNPLDLRVEANYRRYVGEPDADSRTDSRRLLVPGTGLDLAAIRADGYDGVIHYDTDQYNRSGGTSYVWWDSGAAKLAPAAYERWWDIPVRTGGNRGTYNPGDPDVGG